MMWQKTSVVIESEVTLWLPFSLSSASVTVLSIDVIQCLIFLSSSMNRTVLDQFGSMSIHLNLYVSLTIFFCLFPSIVTQTPDCSITNQILCNGNFSKDNASRSQYECSAYLSSSYSLPSCDNGDPNMTIFWFWYDDVCRYNTVINVPFATVSTAGIPTCRNRSSINITYEACTNNYVFNRTTMVIKNMTNTAPQKYLCFLSNNQAVMNYSSTRIYSINI